MSAENGAASVVLIADDDDDIRMLVGIRLERDGHRVLRAADGEEALQMARAERPDLCILDLMMPRRDGLGVTRALRADAETAGMPVVLLTAQAGEDDVANGLAAGADEYLAKPFSPQDLAASVQRGLACGASRSM